MFFNMNSKVKCFYGFYGYSFFNVITQVLKHIPQEFLDW